jgi:Pyridoxamine 5'-phosphate oxidase
MGDAARRLLDASSLCAIATVRPDGSAYVNTAYFAFSSELDLVWMSEPNAQHSRNIRERGTAAIAVYDSTQVWGRPDRGIQLFGTAREATDSSEAETMYAGRFSEFVPENFDAYRFYVFRPVRLKLFDEEEFGGGAFVTARVEGSGQLVWEETEIYGSTR